jgi:sulfite reductase (NADPH) flavoprotein alpha-component
VQEREAAGATGKNWLFFGGRSLYHDFLYQLEWQQALKRKALHRVDVAFSRDQAEKIYVQHRIRQAGKDLFAWLSNGAYFYVCGDASAMAPDVNACVVGRGARAREHGCRRRPVRGGRPHRGRTVFTRCLLKFSNPRRQAGED